MKGELIPAAWTRRWGARDRTRLRVAGLTVLPALLIGVLLVGIGVDGPLAVIVAAVAGGAATAYFARRRRAAAAPPPAPLRRTAPSPPPARRRSAPALPEPPAPRRSGADRQPTRLLPADPDAAVRQARSVLATSGTRPAFTLLQGAVTEPGVDPVLALSVLDELVDAQSREAERSRDDRPYAEAIALLTDLVQRHPQVPDGRSLLHSHRAQYLMFQATRLAARQTEPDASTRTSLLDLYRTTERELREARSAATAYGPVWAKESAALGMLLCHDPTEGGPDRMDEGITLIRQALDDRIPLPARHRAETCLDLATALTLRLRRRDSAQDRDEARRLLAQATTVDPSSRPDADALLAELEASR